MLRKTFAWLLALCLVCPLAVHGTEAVYIYSVSDLENLSLRVSEGDTMNGVSVYLCADLTMDRPFTPIGGFNTPFCGSFYGEGHTVKGLRVEGEGDCNGLFGCIVGGGVYDLALEDAYVRGLNYCGLIVGRLFGYEGYAAVKGCTATGTVRGVSYVGGLVGFSYASAQGVYGECVIKDCGFTGTAEGDLFVGGVCGKAAALSTASRGESRIENCKSYGSVRAKGAYGTMCGGIVGALDTNSNGGSSVAKVSDCFSYSRITAEKAAAGGISGVVGAEGYGATATVEGSLAFGVVSAKAIAGGVAGALEMDNRGVASLKNSISAATLVGSDLYPIAKGDGAENCAEATENTVFNTETELPQHSLGDVNGDGTCDSTDAVLILKADVGTARLGCFAASSADTNGDGTPDNPDAVLILKYDAGIIDTPAVTSFTLP